MSQPVIVIGSGPAGAMAALELVKRGVPVTMLESGDRLPQGIFLRALGRTVVRRFPPLARDEHHSASSDPRAAWFRELAPGGLSNHWTGAVPRFTPEDFTEGERLHERYRWPVYYEELVPYYERAEALLGINGDPRSVPGFPAQHVAFERRLPKDWQRVASHAAKLGHGLTPMPLADGAPWLVKRTATSFNSYTSIVSRLLASKDFRLVLGAHALRIELARNGRGARSVIYYDRVDCCERRADAAAVVLAAGPIASTKLLFDSACSAFPDGLGNDAGLLGKYLHDHPKDWFEVEIEEPLRRLSYPACFTRAPYCDSSPLLAAQCTLVSTRDARDKLLALFPTTSHWIGAVVFGTVVPDEQCFVRPDPAKKDEFGTPQIDIHMHYDERGKQNTARARERFIHMLESAGCRPRLRYELPNVEPPGSTVHYGGTVRMHDSPAYGVTDRWNRLHTVDNVTVVDASCFTTGVEKNPTLTVMALAARAASKLACDLKAA